MTARYHSSRPDQWVEPRQHLTDAARRHAFGPLQPMPQRPWWVRMLGRNTKD